MTRTIEPLEDRVLLRLIEKPEISKGGIYVPDTAKDKPTEAEVIAVGPGDGKKPMTLAVGDKVIFGKYAGIEIEVDDKTLLIIRQGDIAARVFEPGDVMAVP